VPAEVDGACAARGSRRLSAAPAAAEVPWPDERGPSLRGVSVDDDFDGEKKRLIEEKLTRVMGDPVQVDAARPLQHCRREPSHARGESIGARTN
jgi:hypothetical protein